MELLRRRYGVGCTVEFAEYFSVGLEYLRGRDYARGDTESFALEVILEF